jgi:hypothetical protein
VSRGCVGIAVVEGPWLERQRDIARSLQTGMDPAFPYDLGVVGELC